jgi:hypothetical protein
MKTLDTIIVVKKMNIYHRYITVPFEYEKPKKFLESSDSFINNFSHDDIQSDVLVWLSKYDLRISNVVEAFYTSASNRVSVPIHNDLTIKPGVRDAAKLNFTWGPSESKTRWWRVRDESKLIEIIHEDSGYNQGLRDAGIIPDIDCHKCYSANEEDLELVHEATIDKPSLLNVGQLHSTHNPNPTEDRWTLSLTLLTNDGKHLTFSDALHKLGELTYE